MKKFLLVPICLSMLAVGCTHSAKSASIIAEEAQCALSVYKVGDTFQVKLIGNPTTGYTWETVSIPSFLRLDGKNVISDNPNLVGSPVKYSLNFTVLDAGRGELELQYKRPWEKTAIKTFKCTVTASR